MTDPAIVQIPHHNVKSVSL